MRATNELSSRSGEPSTSRTWCRIARRSNTVVDSTHPKKLLTAVPPHLASEVAEAVDSCPERAVTSTTD